MIQDAALPIDRSIGAIDLPMSVSDLAIGPQKDLSIASMDQSVTVDLKPLLDAASVTDFATANCSTAGCPANQVCVKEHDSGGACLPPAADGSCPADHLLENGCCVYDVTTYNCRPLPNSCNGVPSCACAASLCLCTCQGASASEVDCACFYP